MKCLGNSELDFSILTPPLCSHVGFPVIKWSIEFPQLLNPLQETYLVKVMELQGAANFSLPGSVWLFCESDHGIRESESWKGPLRLSCPSPSSSRWGAGMASQDHTACGWRARAGIHGSVLSRVPPSTPGCPSLFRNSGKLSRRVFPPGGWLCLQADDLVRATQALRPMNESLSTEKFVVLSAGRPIGYSGERGGDGEG